MNEHLLHYIWQHQKFDKSNLKLVDGSLLAVFKQGFHNYNSGPDFEEAKIKINQLEWAGSIEIHINASDWDHHKHYNDPAYDNVILHVVWNNDREIRVNNDTLPTLELKQLVDPSLLEKYQRYLNSDPIIACESQIDTVPEIVYRGIIDKVAVERLESKAEEILVCLKTNKNDWERITYQIVAQNFGFSTNKEAFRMLSEKLPFEVLKKSLNDLTETEALFFGQAGFLSEPEDNYQKKLSRIFEFLSNKYSLNAPMSKYEWKFGRMRPANFPSIRIAQLSNLFHQNPNLFSKLISSENPHDLKNIIQINSHGYWVDHYDFGRKFKQKNKKLSSVTLDNLVINSLCPILTAYSKYLGDQQYLDRAVSFLESIKAEVNTHTKKWVAVDRKPVTAFESQAQIQLIKYYCKKRKCLSCNIGVYLIGK